MSKPKTKASVTPAVKFKSTFTSLSSDKVKQAYQANPKPVEAHQRCFLTTTVFYFGTRTKSVTLFKGQSGAVNNKTPNTNGLYTFYPDIKGYDPVAISRSEFFLENEPIGHEV